MSQKNNEGPATPAELNDDDVIAVQIYLTPEQETKIEVNENLFDDKPQSDDKEAMEKALQILHSAYYGIGDEYYKIHGERYFPRGRDAEESLWCIDANLLDDVSELIWYETFYGLQDAVKAIKQDDNAWNLCANHQLVARDILYLFVFLAAERIGKADRHLCEILGYHLIEQAQRFSGNTPMRPARLSLDVYSEVHGLLYRRDGVVLSPNGYTVRHDYHNPDVSRRFCLRLVEELYGGIAEDESPVFLSWFINPTARKLIGDFQNKLEDLFNKKEENNEN